MYNNTLTHTRSFVYNTHKCIHVYVSKKRIRIYIRGGYIKRVSFISGAATMEKKCGGDSDGEKVK